MIIKKRSKPRLLEKFEILHARLSTQSPHYHAVNYRKESCEKGYKGELEVDYYLNILASENTILQDVCLRTNGQTFQIDNLIISPKAIYLIEAKNHSGTITFSTDPDQFTQSRGEIETGYNHPITQVKLQKLKLQNWLKDNNFPAIPIYPFIAISNPSTKIEVNGDREKIAKLVAHGDQVPWLIMNLEEGLHSKQNFQHQKIGHEILRNCFDFDKNIYKDLPIQPREILNGIRCINCNYLGMQKQGWTWICHKCNSSNKLAPQYSVHDYLLLRKPWVTNGECKSFLKIESRYNVRRILEKTPYLKYIPAMRRWEKVNEKIYNITRLADFPEWENPPTRFTNS